MNYCASVTAGTPITARVIRCDIILSKLKINLGNLNILLNLSFKKNVAMIKQFEQIEI